MKPKPQTLAQGAEAKIILDNQGKIIKHRVKKSYRIPELDERIRKSRTKSESKLIKKADEIINTPKILETLQNEKVIEMEFIKGKKLSTHLDKLPIAKQKQILKQIGIDIAKLHNENIIHNDLTTSNMILKKDKVFFIDFGLGYFNGKYEDKAVDIHLLKQALVAKHFKNWKQLFAEFEKGYLEESEKLCRRNKKRKAKTQKISLQQIGERPRRERSWVSNRAGGAKKFQTKKNYQQAKSDAEKVLERLKAVEKRGRYKH